MQYRKEIDGLRAIAVLPVILFHGGFEFFSGGYVGVDVFFVISGYLITSIIIEDIHNQRFSVLAFYERRARRILPALSIVLLFTTLAAFILMPARLLQIYSQSLVSVSVFVSNFFFYLTSGYFSTAADEKPLLHTWSLAVEEQYYIFFPLMVALLWSLGKKWVLACIALLTIASLVLAHYLAYREYSDANFYLIFSRAWELFVGSLLAFFTLKSSIPKIGRESLALLGLLLIVFSTVAFDDGTPFPSFYTLVPVLGTGLIIMYGDASTRVGQLLSWRLLVFIGLISYSLYLWHQPLFAFLRLKTIGQPPLAYFYCAMLATFIFSVFSWKYVEQPFRNKKAFSRAHIFKYSAASIIVFFSIGLAGHYYQGFEQRFDTSAYNSTIQSSPRRGDCHTEGKNYLAPDKACTYFGKKITWAIFGDSHVVETGYALATDLEPYDEGLLHLSFSDCPPALLLEASEPGCSRWLNESLRYLETRTDIKNVLIAYRYSYYLHGNHVNDYPRLPDIDPIHLFTPEARHHLRGDAKAVLWQGLETIITRLIASGKTIYIMYPVPELPLNINKAVMPFSVFSTTTMLDLDRATTAEYYFTRHTYIIDHLDALPFDKQLHALKPFDILCDGQYCPAVKDGKALYFDDDHVSLVGAGSIVHALMDKAGYH